MAAALTAVLTVIGVVYVTFFSDTFKARSRDS